MVHGLLERLKPTERAWALVPKDSIPFNFFFSAGFVGITYKVTPPHFLLQLKLTISLRILLWLGLTIRYHRYISSEETSRGVRE